MTAIGLIHVVITMRSITTVADDLLAVDALLFLCACLVSYWALRIWGSRRLHQLERIADLGWRGSVLSLSMLSGRCSVLRAADTAAQRLLTNYTGWRPPQANVRCGGITIIW